MRPYEVMIIFDATLEEDSVQSVLDRAGQALKGAGAEVGQVDRWGKRRLAYEIDHKVEGHYAVLSFSGEPAAVVELDWLLSLADEVIRHKVIRLPEAAAAQGERPQPQPANE